MLTAAPLTWTGEPQARAWRAPELSASPLAYHRSLPGYQPTALTELPDLARELGTGRVFVKDESARLGLPAFKILGASWAIERALAARPVPPALLVAATDGNHGRAVARVAAERGLAARIVVPAGVHVQAIAAIAAEGAEVVLVRGSYDDAVEQAAKDAAAADAASAADGSAAADAPVGAGGVPSAGNAGSADGVDGPGGPGGPGGPHRAGAAGALLIQDMAWPGYAEIPAWIVEGYATMFAEIDEQLDAAGSAGPGLVVIPAGVGSLAQAAIAHYRRPGISSPPALLCVEPENAACVQHSLRAGRLATIATSATIMAGLNCGTPSSAAWPYLQSGLDAAVAITDTEAARAAADLHRLGVPAGPCGAAPLAGVRQALSAAAAVRSHLGVTAGTPVVLLCTEGASANPVDHAPPAS